MDKENHQLCWWEEKAYGYGQNKNFPILQVLDLLATTNELYSTPEIFAAVSPASGGGDSQKVENYRKLYRRAV